MMYHIASIEMVVWIDDDKQIIQKMDIFPADRALPADDDPVVGGVGG